MVAFGVQDSFLFHRSFVFFDIVVIVLECFVSRYTSIEFEVALILFKFSGLAFPSMGQFRVLCGLSNLVRHEGWFHFTGRQSLPIKSCEPRVRLQLLDAL